MPGYDFTAIETKWQRYWDEHRTFEVPNPGQEGFRDRPKYYVLDMFPYPSGAGLHVGHPEGYTATDIIARYRRMRGYNVLHPMGYDSFGLPAEQYAVEHGVHPRVTTEQNIANIERQIKMFGFSYDWSRRVATTDPQYYRWTQWIFLQMFHSWYDPAVDAARPIRELMGKLEAGKYLIDLNGNLVSAGNLRGLENIAGMEGALRQWHEMEPDQQKRLLDEYRLAYQDEVPVNWCPALGTVLANEEVTNDGRSERGNHPVYRRPLRQWMLRITAYAERLQRDLDGLDWPEPIKIMQRNWIGRSTGAEVDFPLETTVAQTSEEQGRDWFDDRRQRGFPGTPEEGVIRVYTTRPDTLYGATYMVLAPEHPLVEEIATPDQADAVRAYVRQAARKSELERTAEAKQKTGVFTGAYAVNPLSRQRIPIWVADYVLLGYGTGAIMAVPAHDTRDFEFATQMLLPIVRVVDEYAVEVPDTLANRARFFPTDDNGISGVDVQTEGILRVTFQDKDSVSRLCADAGVGFSWTYAERKLPFVSVGIAVHSGPYDGLSTPQFKQRVTEDLFKTGLGIGAVNYKLRDWLFSRQRYWGEPFPIVHCPACGTVALPEEQLPLLLPEMEDFTPATSDDPEALPAPPLGKVADWANTACPGCGGPARRELNTMPQWAGSCWYYLRYLDPRNERRFCCERAQAYWMDGNGVDLYVGGAEHAVLHLLYARFWHKVLFDLGYVSTPEPFAKLFNQGMIRSFAYRDARGMPVGYDRIDFREDGAYHRDTGERLAESVEKMSKSLKNVVNPDEVIARYGADTFRLYEMFMGPLEASKPWNTRDVPGVHRFLQRVWRMLLGDEDHPAMLSGETADEALERALHRTIRKVGADIEAMRFNTAIAAMMEFVNAVFKVGRISRDQAERFVLVLAPFAPHLAEELWRQLGHDGSLAYEDFPQYDEALTQEATIELPVQLNGKVRSRITVAADADQQQVLAAALADEKIAAQLAGRQVVKKIVVPGRLVNIVLK